ncbi:MAG TPA: M48 family metalloprotease [Mycobacteriales bacterium]|nr:M48 family metalloprotease [Mycobacteriales bacterium]
MSRVAPAVAMVLLLLALATVIGVATPWRALPAASGRPVAAAPDRDFTPAERAREDRFHRAVRPPGYTSLLVGLAVAALLALTPLGAGVVTGAARPFGGGWVAQVLAGGLALLLIGRIAVLPFDARVETVLRRAGLSTQTWASWLADVGKGFAVSSVLTLVGLVGLVGLARAWPHRWWIPAAAIAAALVFVVSFAAPVVVEPLFNRFTSMPAGPLRDSLLDLAREDGVRVDEVLVADASRRTTALNAYASGFGATKRIVVYDTLLRSAGPEEVRLVVAHELGHAKRRDVLRASVIGALAAAIVVCLLFVLLGPGAGDPRLLPRVLLLISVVGLVAAPVGTLVSRRVEAFADVHSLDLTRDPATFVASERRLALRNLSDLDPSPLVYAMFATHPSAPQRIALARTWARVHGVPEPPSAVAPSVRPPVSHR